MTVKVCRKKTSFGKLSKKNSLSKQLLFCNIGVSFKGRRNKDKNAGKAYRF